MKSKANVTFFVVLGIVLFIVYIIIAAFPLKKEIQLVPEWTTKIDSELQNTDMITEEPLNSSIISNIPANQEPSIIFSANAENAISFRLGNKMGYFLEDGTIAALIKFPNQASISDSYWTIYQNDSDKIDLYSNTNTLVTTIDKSGFPWIKHNSIFMFAPGGNSVSQFNQQGEEIWNYVSYAPIIAFETSNAASVIGLTDGNLIVYSNKTKSFYSLTPGGSTYPVILGAAIDEKGEYIACISGIDEQRFILAQTLNGQPKIVFHEYLPKNRHEQSHVSFSNSGKKVFYQYEGGLGIADCESLTSLHIDFEGNILSIQELPNLNLTFVLCKTNDLYTVYLVEGYSKLVGSFDFEGENAFIRTNKNALFVGKDDTISKISIIKK